MELADPTIISSHELEFRLGNPLQAPGVRVDARSHQELGTADALEPQPVLLQKDGAFGVGPGVLGETFEV